MSKLSRIRLPAALLSLLLLRLIAPVHAQQTDCGAQLAVDHAFSSGATWSMCIAVEESHGLTVRSVRYRAPGDSLRPVIAEAHLGQLLLHYHDSRAPIAQIQPSLQPPRSAEATDIISMNDNSCDGTRLNVSGHAAAVCSRVSDNRILAKYAQRPAIQSQKLELSSAFQRETLSWTSSFTFTEDGQIRPGLSLSGRAALTNQDPEHAQAIPADTEALTRATLLANWRMVFELDTPTADRVEQFDFPLDTTAGNRRPMQVRTLTSETLLQVERENFRGWRIVDASGAGYYLDPANSGFSFSNTGMEWAQSDGAVTVFQACERHAWLNSGETEPGNSASRTTGCGESLDDFIDGDPLQGNQPVLWYSLSRTLDPSIEDWPVLRDVSLQFDLTPFDWTAASPFEVND
ncbi:copper amine oxidase [Granulosicoccus sp. 3-233]|uniref:copper amine oxidase n=1 Tax=Granulosicoccus sp. 3-233 TaxID=3417969 RepID=UPI003D325919